MASCDLLAQGLKILRFDGGYKPGTIVYDVIPTPVDWI